MEYRNFGNTDLFVSEVGFGAWQIGGATKLGGRQIGMGKTDDKVSIQTLEQAFENGINFYDTSDVYGMGHSQELIGKVFKNKRDKIIISSKAGNKVNEKGEAIKDFSPLWLRTSLEKSLKQLRTDYIDLFQLHSPFGDFEYTDEIVSEFEKFRNEGKIRYYGISLMGPGRGVDQSEQGLKILRSRKECHFLQFVYNIIHRQADEKLLPECKKKEIGVIIRVPLESGFLTGKYDQDHVFPEDDARSHRYPEKKRKEIIQKVSLLDFLVIPHKRNLAQAAIKFCLQADGVSTVIVGAKTPEQVMQNIEASHAPALTREEISRIEKVIPR